jgi:pimeloyl-ACP methyl ester carboxylesterase
LLVLLTGCSTASQRFETYRSAVPAASPGARVEGPVAGVVYVANGAGDPRTLSDNLTRVVRATGAPLEIRTVDWSLGYGRYIADQVVHANHLDQGRRLATDIVAYRQSYPTRRIYLLGHSAGCAVVLAAAESLPPDSVNGLVLLAPSVCHKYDLRRALSSARDGIDVFYSGRDRLFLGLGITVFGTAERECRTAAGQTGFTPVVTGPDDAALYGRLRQHAWDPAVEWTGNGGGHFGTNEPAFLRAYVLPLLL